MNRATVLLAASVLVLVPHALVAQTLDELQHPLLARGKAAVSADYDNWAIEHGTVDIEYGSMTFYQPQYVLTPALSFGLGRNLQIAVAGTYQWPTVFSDPVFEAWSYFREKNTVKSASVDLVFRPRPNLEIGASVLGGRATFGMDYARSRGVNAFASQNYRSTIISLHGTWLPSARTLNTAIRADLPGLHHPLLEKNRWRFDWEIMRRSYGNGFSDTNDGGPDFVSDDATSRDMRVRFAAAYGIGGRAQVAADAYWHPPFHMAGVGRSLYLNYRGAPVSSTTYSSERFDRAYGVRLDGRWRPTGRVEAFATGTWEPQRISYASSRPALPADYRTSTLTFGGTWLSRAPRKSAPLTADINGLYHPLVEPKQIQVDSFAYFHAYRDPDRLFDLDVRVYRVRATTGIFEWLQASGYAGALLSKHWMSRGAFERHPSVGGELRLRVKSGTELYGTLEQHAARFIGRFPMFVPGTGADSSFDFLNPDFEGTYTAHLGVRFVF